MAGRKFKGILAALIASLLWGGFYPVGRWMSMHGAAELDGLTVSLTRFAIAAVLLSPALFAAEPRKLLRRDWRRALVVFVPLALIGIVGEGTLVYISTRYTTAARSSLMANTAPVFTLLFSRLFTGEKLTGRKLCGMSAGLAGIALVLAARGGDVFSGGRTMIAGDLLAVGSGVCWALYTVLGVGPTERYGALFSTELMFILGTLMLLPAVLCSGGVRELAALPPAGWIGIAYLGCMSSALAFALWYVALKYLAPGELGAFGYLTPLLAAGISGLAFAERFNALFLLALVLIPGGVALMVDPPKKRRA